MQQVHLTDLQCISAAGQSHAYRLCTCAIIFSTSVYTYTSRCVKNPDYTNEREKT